MHIVITSISDEKIICPILYPKVTKSNTVPYTSPQNNSTIIDDKSHIAYTNDSTNIEDFLHAIFMPNGKLTKVLTFLYVLNFKLYV